MALFSDLAYCLFYTVGVGELLPPLPPAPPPPRRKKVRPAGVCLSTLRTWPVEAAVAQWDASIFRNPWQRPSQYNTLLVKTGNKVHKAMLPWLYGSQYTPRSRAFATFNLNIRTPF